ncbi:hypothetical protein F3J45_01035 [Pantoea sp. Ap-967]|uniref:DUF6864 domain-containing function n=1 Tax=Pantoea sp. Ap-967 TaxID=2608362 RepID=UPI0014232D17|nr:hypothetical protein [Pantoea sp. Ap-967]NIE73051.1 hypothetical protein [Pantoea sp. Ap-967]
MEITASVNGMSIISSGVVHISSNWPINFEVQGLKLQVIFVENSSVKVSRYETKVENGIWNLYLTNFSHTTGEGLYSPVPIATVEGKQLSMTFSVDTISRNEGLRVFSYTFMLG